MTAIATTTRQITAVRRAEARGRVRRARSIVLALDAVILACEDAHLADMVTAHVALAEQAATALAAADALLVMAGYTPPVRALVGTVKDYLDAAFDVQEAVLDVLIPKRRQYADLDAIWPATSVEVA